jgi:hypothetical protein
VAKAPRTAGLPELVAARFEALAESARLNILHARRPSEKSESPPLAETGRGRATTAWNLRHLHGLGFIDRRQERLYVSCGLADHAVVELRVVM